MFERPAFHIRTVYVNSHDPNRIVWPLGKPQFRKGISRSQLICLLRFVRAAQTLYKFRVFSIIRSLFDAIFSQDVAKEGR